MDKELKAYGYIYLTMRENETEQEAINRLEQKLEEAGIIEGDLKFEVQEI